MADGGTHIAITDIILRSTSVLEDTGAEATEVTTADTTMATIMVITMVIMAVEVTILLLIRIE